MARAYDEAMMGGRRIALAHESPFSLGRTHVQPSTRSIAVGGRSEIIEPRMMQVLVALAGAKGEVVTRDELLELCWEGRVVGEDALSRVLWRLRQVLASLGEPGFEIETIPRVGYRLVVAENPAPVEHAVATSAGVASNGFSRRTLAAGAVALAGVAAIGGLAWAGGQKAHEPPEAAKRFYDQAVDLRGQGGFAESQQVLAYLREAVRIDPEYAQAWGALALQYCCMLNWYAPRPDANQLKIAGRSAARRALQLEPGDPDAVAALLMMDSPYGRWNEVEGGLRGLLVRHPGHDFAELGLANLMIETGRFAEAIEVYGRLSAANPSWSFGRWRVIDALLTLGRLQEAEEQIETGLRLWPRNFNMWIAKGRYLLVSGDPAGALRFIRDPATRPIGDDEFVRREAIVVEAAAEQSPETVKRARDTLVALARTGEVAIPAMELPLIGEVDLAFAMYEGYFLNRGPWKTGPMERRYTGGLFESDTERLRKDPRFMPLLRAIGLDRYYRLAVVKPDFLQA